MGSSCSIQARRNQANLDEKTRKIDTLIKKHHKEESRVIKVLLLGPGECGKSTILKQIKFIHNKGYTQEELAMYRPAIIANTVEGLLTIIRAMVDLKINFVHPLKVNDVRELFDNFQRLQVDGKMTPELAKVLKSIWQDVGVQQCVAKRAQFNLLDSAIYFLENLDRITKMDYIPTFKDILRCRIQTFGAVEMSFRLKTTLFRLIDVGGQRSNRKRWIHCFDQVTAVIFVAALSDYHRQLEENSEINRLEESLTLFDSIVKCPHLVRGSKLLFLNKTDIFREDIEVRRIKLKDYFVQYRGEAEDYVSAMEWILMEFEKVYDNKMQMDMLKLYSHFTCATDTENIKFVFHASSDTIIKQNLTRVGLL